MEENNATAIIAAARQGLAPTKLAAVGAVETWFAPFGAGGEGKAFTVNVEAGADKPLRKRGSIVVFDAASFNQALADNSDAGNVAIYMDRNPDKPSVVAVLNGNGKTGAGWGDFRVTIQFRETPQWAKWRKMDGQMVKQEAFAEFIEENLDDIADPSGASLLEIATYLQVTRTVNFKSALRLTSGAIQFQNAQDDDAKVGAGLIAVPETFKLGIAPLFGLSKYTVPARFRYRLTDGKLTLGFKLQRIEDLMSTLVEDVIARIERGANVSVMDGLPPAVTQ